VTYDSAADHFDTLLEAAGGQAKIVVTSRTHFFESDKQVKNRSSRAEAAPRTASLPPATLRRGADPRFLTNLLGDSRQADTRFELIREVRDLLGLSGTPRMLSFIAELPEVQLREAKERLGHDHGGRTVPAPAEPMAGVRRRTGPAAGDRPDLLSPGAPGRCDPGRPDDVAEARADHPSLRADRGGRQRRR
jgi:hypothetical protein